MRNNAAILKTNSLSGILILYHYILKTPHNLPLRKSISIKYIKVILICLIVTLFTNVIAQEKINLVGKLNYSGLPIHDVWGYSDKTTGKKYALLCASTSGFKVIDITTPQTPIQVGSLNGGGVQPIDLKTWKNYAYVVAESASVSGKVIDLTDPTNPVQVGTFPAGHNITISDSGYLYLSAPGLKIFNLNADPTTPLQIYNDNSCQGHDVSIVGNRLYDFSWNCGTRIYNISNPDTLILLGTVPPSGINHHSGWPSEDGNFLFICDELAAPSQNDITVWNISNPTIPMLVDSFADANAYVHNLYIKGKYAFVSYYRAGFRVFNVLDPTNFFMVAEYDTDSTLSGPGYSGNFGLFTEWGTDTILASDEENGLYIFKVSGLTTSLNKTIENKSNITLFPNPASQNVIIKSTTALKNITILNITGQIVQQFKKIKNTQQNINLSSFNKGIYFIKSIDYDNKKQINKLIIN